MIELSRSLAAIFARDLTTLRMEIEAYPVESDLWRLVPGISNSGGTLGLHLAGNLQHFIGAILGGTGYRRDRDAEFGARDVPRERIVGEIEAARAAVTGTLEALDPAVLAAGFPEPVAGVRVNTADFLIHLAVHLGYHLGQVDYHRRMVTGGKALGGSVSPTRLWSAVETPG
jgi:hypothetical protein